MSIVVYNDAVNSHKLMLERLIREADKIYIAVAFLKKSGLDQLFDFANQGLRNKVIKMVIGGDFGQTEPCALRTILDSRIDGRLMKYSDKHSMFHPKMYLFEKDVNCTIVIGSANLTQSGLTTNHEVSIMVESHTDSSEWKTAINLFNKFCSQDNSAKISSEVVKKYEEFYNLQKRWNAADEPDNENRGLKDRFALYLPEFREAQKDDPILKALEKEQSYAEARNLLDELVRLQIPQDNLRFEEIIRLLVGRNSCWYSTGLQRMGLNGANNHKREYQLLVSYLIDNHQDKPVPALYEAARRLAPGGVGPNHITEMLITLDRDKFSIMNHSSISALKYGGLADIKGDGLTYSGDDYQQFCSLCQSVKNYFGFTSMLELDSFFYYIFRSTSGA